MKTSWVCLGSALALACIIGTQLSGEYIRDDAYLVKYNRQMQAADGLYQIFAKDTWLGSTGKAGQAYHPVAMATFWLEAQLWGKTIEYSRLLNLLVHLLCATLLWLLLCRWHFREETAFFAALLFLLHPSATEPVMWLTGRHDSLGVCFALLAFWSWPDLRKPQEKWQIWTRAMAVGVFCALAFLCKEIHVVMPALFALLLLWNPHQLQRNWRHWLLLLSPIAGVVFVLGLRSSLGISSSSALLWSSPLQHLRHFATICWHFLQQLTTLSNGQTLGMFVVLPDIAVLAFWGLFSVALVWVLRLWVRKPSITKGGLLFGVGWFLVCLAPHMVSLPVLGMYGNRYAYFPMVGFSIIAASLLEGITPDAFSKYQRVIYGLGLSLLVFAGWQLHQEAGYWRSAAALYGHQLKQTPTNAYALYHVGHAVRMKSGCRQALSYFRRATKELPTYTRAWHNLAGCLINTGQFRKAIQPARQVIRLAPQKASAHYNLALALVRTGQLARAEKAMSQAVRLAPHKRAYQHVLAQIQAIKMRKTINPPRR